MVKRQSLTVAFLLLDSFLSTRLFGQITHINNGHSDTCFKKNENYSARFYVEGVLKEVSEYARTEY